MTCDNNAKTLTRDILRRVAAAFLENKLPEKADRIPLELRPQNGMASRCCVYKDRALIKYRVMAALGFGAEDETDELTPLSEYAARALQRTSVNTKILDVIALACSACPHTRFYVSDACRNCLARSCQCNCPVKCISIDNGRAHIDPDRCVNCGKCRNACPFHAIIQTSLPCEDVCPAEAISRDSQGKAAIDFDKCVYCGKCITACPFGAIVERSQIIDVLLALRLGRRVYALPAPALFGQWEASPAQINSAFLAMGFHAVEEVALGADKAARMEAEEFMERRRHGAAFMTTSCCPAYVQAAKKLVPKIQPFISATPSPLQLTAKSVKDRDPQAVAVFIGPCVAKRRESMDYKLVDFYITFSEADSLFEAFGIELARQKERETPEQACREGRGFPLSGGVLSAVTAHLPRGQAIGTASVNGLNRPALKLLQSYATGNCPANLVEVMNCEGGCINGPAVVAPPVQAKSRIEQFASQSRPAYAATGDFIEGGT